MKENESISSKVHNITRITNLATLTQYRAQSLCQNSKTGKGIKDIKHRKGRSPIISICTWPDFSLKSLYRLH